MDDVRNRDCRCSPALALGSELPLVSELPCGEKVLKVVVRTYDTRGSYSLRHESRANIFLDQCLRTVSGMAAASSSAEDPGQVGHPVQHWNIQHARIKQLPIISLAIWAQEPFEKNEFDLKYPKSNINQ
eukprot:1089999-Amphidinium_carterae.1